MTQEGNWIFGEGYQDTKLGRHPTKADLDRVSLRHPICIIHSSGHMVVVNSFALKMAKINSRTVNPPGGVFDRDANGEPNGICRESAGSLIYKAGPLKPEPTEKEATDGILECFRQFARHGITSIADAGAGPEKLKLYRKAFQAGQRIRITMMIYEKYFDEFNKAGIATGFGDDNIKIGSIKMFHGNSLSARTCWLKQPYEMINPKTGKKDYYGIPPARSRLNLIALLKDIMRQVFTLPFIQMVIVRSLWYLKHLKRQLKCMPEIIG